MSVLKFVTGSVSHSSNCGSLTLGSHASFKVNSNCGRVTIGNNCSVICENNCGQISIGKNCTITNCKNNCGTITIGSHCTIESAKNNAGHIRVGPEAAVGNIDGNCGNIDIGPDSKLPSKVSNNAGRILVDGKKWSGKARVEEPKRTVVAGGPVKPMAPAPPAPGPASAPPPHHLVDNHNPAPTPPQVPSRIKVKIPGSEPSPPQQPQQARSPADGEENVCAICMERKRNMAFLCGHTSCAACAQDLLVCHLCRVPIERKIRLYE